MNWLAFLKLVLQIAARLTEIAHDKRLMDAGEARALSASLTKQQGRVSRAMKIRREIAASLEKFPDTIRNDDGHRRDE
jgi:hypothetical protein